MSDESEISAILYCEFHSTVGPKIIHQDPLGFLTSDKFQSLAAYIIPKTGLQGQLMTVNSLGYKIIGFPVGIDDSRFSRNRYIFNLCFVCEASKRTVQYEPLVRKLARYLTQLEYECKFLTKIDNNGESMQLMLCEIRTQLNSNNCCNYTVTDSTRIHLKVVNVHSDPREVLDHEVPILNEEIITSEWDLTTQQLIPYIDGYRHIAKISADAAVEVSLVKACIQNMIYYGLVTLIPIFSYSSVYVATPKLPELLRDSQLRKNCISSVRLANSESHSGSSASPNFKTIFSVYCSFKAGVTVKDISVNCQVESLGMDIRSVVKFGVVHGLLRKIDCYPILTTTDPSSIHRQRSGYQYFDGNHSFDSICTKTHKSYRDLDALVKKHPGVIVINK